MLRKYGKFYAEWYPSGKRTRKAFPTKKQAQRFQDRMRAEVAAKKARASQPSGRSARRGLKPARPLVSESRAKRSAQSQVA